MMTSEFQLKEEMAVNVKWAGIGQLIGYLIQFVVWAALARLLPPKNFGALGVALAITNLALIFNELGMSAALIQRKDLKPEHSVAAFWISIVMGVVFAIFIIISSPLIAWFFQDSAIYSLVLIFAIKLLIDSFGIVQDSLLNRDLHFKRLTLIEIYSSLIFGAVALPMAYAGFGIISIGVGYLAKSVLRVVLLWYSRKFITNFKFDKRSFIELLNFGKNIVGFRIVSYLCGNIDIALIGKFLGTAPLGYYSMALNLVNFPRQKLSSIVSSVAFPAFSKLQEHLEDLRRAYFKLIRYASAINFPLLAGLAFLAPQFIRVVYSFRWNEMVLPLKILCVYGICFSITTFNGMVFNCTGRPQDSLKFSIFNLAGIVLALALSLKYRLIGVTIALSGYAVIMNIVSHYMVSRIIKLKFISYLEAMLPAIVSSAVMLLGMILFLRLERILFRVSDLGELTVMIIVGAGIYSLTFFLVSRKTFYDAIDIIRKMF